MKLTDQILFQPEFNRFANYLADGWTTQNGCQACKEETISIRELKVRIELNADTCTGKMLLLNLHVYWVEFSNYCTTVLVYLFLSFEMVFQLSV